MEAKTVSHRQAPHKQESSLSHFVSHGHFVTEDASGYRSRDSVKSREIFQREKLSRAPVCVRTRTGRCVALWVFVLGFAFSILMPSLGFCLDLSGFAPGGTVMFSFSSQPLIGVTTTVKATFMPTMTGANCTAGISVPVAYPSGGVKIVNSKGGKKNISVKEGQGVTVEFTFEVKRPGVWRVGAVLVCQYPGDDDPYRGFRIHGAKIFSVTEDSVQFYDWTPEMDIQKMIYPWAEMVGRIPTYIVMRPPTDKGKIIVREETTDTKILEKRKEARKNDPVHEKRYEKFIAYLSKEVDLGFEPDYAFRLEYLNMSESMGADPSLIKKPAAWSVQGSIGTITQDGIFAATKFGHGKICAKHGVLEDCLDVEVAPLPNPSPGEKIVDVVVVPYETEEEKEFDEKMKQNELKPFKHLKDVRETLNPKGAQKIKVVEEWKKDGVTKKYYEKEKLIHTIFQPATFSSDSPSKVYWIDKIVLVQGTRKHVAFVPVRADGKIEKKEIKIAPKPFESKTITPFFLFPSSSEVLVMTYPLESIHVVPAKTKGIKPKEKVALKAYGMDTESNQGELADVQWEVIGDIGTIKDGVFEATKKGIGEVKATTVIFQDDKPILKEGKINIAVD